MNVKRGMKLRVVSKEKMEWEKGEDAGVVINIGTLIIKTAHVTE